MNRNNANIETFTLFTALSLLCCIVALTPRSTKAEKDPKEPIFDVYRSGGSKIETAHGFYVGYGEVRQDYLEPLSDGTSRIEVNCLENGINKCTAYHKGQRYTFTARHNDDGGRLLHFYYEDFEQKFLDLHDLSEKAFSHGELSGVRSNKVNAFSIEGEQCYLEFSIIWNLNEKGDGQIRIFADAFAL